MSKYKEPLTVRDNKKDEEVRRASNPAYAYYNQYPRFTNPEPSRMKDLSGKPVAQEDVRVRPRKGTHSPFSNEGPSYRWPTDKDYKK